MRLSTVAIIGIVVGGGAIMAVLFIFRPSAMKQVQDYPAIENEQVVYVFPDDYRGVAKIFMNRDNGMELKARDGTVRIVFPKSGEISIQESDPLLHWNEVHMELSSGEELRFEGDLGPQLPPRAVIVSHLGYFKDNTESWYFVGTADDAEDAAWEAVGKADY